MSTSRKLAMIAIILSAISSMLLQGNVTLQRWAYQHPGAANPTPVLEQPTPDPGPLAGYSREQFGTGWTDFDGDCLNTRNEVLASQGTHIYLDSPGCHVASGRWVDPYSDTVYLNPRQLDIDHRVPLAWAWAHGADKWSRDKRIHFANDPANLVATSAHLNRSKGDKGPDQWLPPRHQDQYKTQFAKIVAKYQLA